MGPEYHHDPSQEFTLFPESHDYPESSQFEEFHFLSEQAEELEYFPLDRGPETQRKENNTRKHLLRWMRKVIIVLCGVLLALTVASRFNTQIHIHLLNAAHDCVQLRMTVSETSKQDEDILFILYHHHADHIHSWGTLPTGVNLLTLDSLDADTIYRLEIYRGDVFVRNFLFNTLHAPAEQTSPADPPLPTGNTDPAETESTPTETPTEEPTEPTVESTEEPTEESTEPTEETTEPTEETTAATWPPYVPPVTQPSTEPVTEPVTEPATEPVTEPETEPVTEPETEPVTEPETEPVTGPETEPVTEP